MKLAVACVLVMLVGLGSTGCVSQAEADRYRTVNRQLEAQIQDLKARLDEKNAMISALQASGDQSNDLAKQLEEAYAQRDRYRTALEQAEAALRDMQGGPLPIELDDALAKMAADNPQLMTYDPELGMIQLKSDLTFGLGSTRISPAAANSLKSLGKVLNSRLALSYEVRIVGHTDNVPVKNPANVKAYGDNWGLSAFRARAVLKALNASGVAPQRMFIAGYGQYHPITPNGPKGAAGNRRVEIYLQPAQNVSTASIPASVSEKPQPAPPTPAKPTAPAPITGPPAGFK